MEFRPNEIFSRICGNLNVDCDENDVNDMYVLNAREVNNAKTKKMIIKLSKPSLKVQLISRNKVRKIKSGDLGLEGVNNIYINDHLTSSQQQLFWKARLKKTDRGWKYAWMKNGRIFARRNDGEAAVWIKQDSDLEKII
ncbi:Uncharacterised protein r2_g4213 [Pycnogonum litorale]